MLVHLLTIYENKYYEEIGEIFTFQNPNVSTVEPADNRSEEHTSELQSPA